MKFAVAILKESIKGREFRKGSRNGNVAGKVIGRLSLHVWRNGSSFLLDCRLVDNDDIRPILGHKACIGMGILVYQDNDHLKKPEMGNTPVYTVQTEETVLSKEELVTKFPKVFKEGVGNLDGEYKIKLDPTVQLVQHAPTFASYTDS